ncbi:MAG: hypothetical protein JWP74_3761 [Marmoricola sp.]|nr:hypothetical protein [Marmoricola sp.]
MPSAEDFDEFYVGTRRGIVLQTFALTGDLVASRSAVRDAYVAARHHWAKVGLRADPESWLRPRAWAAAQRRHTARPWHRERDITPEQEAVLEALHELTDVQRRSLVLAHLTTLPDDELAREIGQPQERVQQHLADATAAIVTALDCDPDEIDEKLQSLGPAADTVKLPRPPIIRRNGLRRRRQHAFIGSVLIAGTTVAAGAFVAVGAPAAAVPDAAKLVSKHLLLSVPQVTNLAPKQVWQATGTSDNTEGTGLNNPCQTARFADTNGLGTLVRRFSTTAGPMHSLVQTVEISNSPGAARTAYRTTLGWYAGCTVARLHLVDAYTVTGVGDEAQILRLRIPDQTDSTYVVGIARTGALTASTVLETHGNTLIPAQQIASTLASSVHDLCASKVAGTCTGTVATTGSLPPRSGEAPGMLAVADLPAIARIAKPWAGTNPTDATTNVAATTCDHADFAGAGATKPVTRTFLIPQANLPQRFGLTETIGRFGSTSAAVAFVDTIIARMKACPHKELGSTVTEQIVRRSGAKGTTYALWRIESQVNKNRDEIKFWMGISRVGSYVAQVNLTPVQQDDVNQATFLALVQRARDRLFEVS